MNVIEAAVTCRFLLSPDKTEGRIRRKQGVSEEPEATENHFFTPNHKITKFVCVRQQVCCLHDDSLTSFKRQTSDL